MTSHAPTETDGALPLIADVPTEWAPLIDGVTDEELKRAAPNLVLHGAHLKKQDLRAFCIRLVATLVHERRRP